ncbi:hypothetical protein THAOC_31718 [Thalassiosira oceanica]|uniref:Uncharacterized protein n=1 Tax=Thalassiosira oceanica TaxID=159749 RepID=K0R8N3_THAOC|nr:hypothetical protein THAOC_31718 [Thalassiosira oceanica]|eukprot:EJK49410.1 hypothetical protein THAOC_31718 [Thalassiosira oceanica]
MDGNWKRNKSRHFFGHSYMAPTPREYFLQKYGLHNTKALGVLLHNSFKHHIVCQRPARPVARPPIGPPSDPARARPQLHTHFSDTPTGRTLRHHEHGRGRRHDGRAYFVSRNEILSFFNGLLDLNLTKIEETASGAVACQLTEYIFPGSIPMSKVNWGGVARVRRELQAAPERVQEAQGAALRRVSSSVGNHQIVAPPSELADCVVGCLE